MMMFVHKGYCKPNLVPCNGVELPNVLYIQGSAKILIFGLLNTANLPAYSTVFKDYVQYIYFSIPMLQVYLNFK